MRATVAFIALFQGKIILKYQFKKRTVDLITKAGMYEIIIK